MLFKQKSTQGIRKNNNYGKNKDFFQKNITFASQRKNVLCLLKLSEVQYMESMHKP